MTATYKLKISFLIMFTLCFILTIQFANGQKLKILPLGNSITFGEDSNPLHQESTHPENCVSYRKDLYDALIFSGYSFDYVGSQKSGWAAGLPKNDLVDSLDYTGNAGFPGITPTQLDYLLKTGINKYYIESPCELNSYGGCPQNYLSVFNPDAILLHIGTNGLTKPDSVSKFRDEVNSMLNFIDSYETSVGKTIPVFLAQIIKHGSGTVANTLDPYTIAYNDLLQNLVSSRTNDVIILVDMENIPGFNYSQSGGDMYDDYHPNESGYAKMATTWFNAMQTYNFRAPVVSNIPDLTINENESSKTINLNNYVFDPQDPDNTITWTYAPNPASHFNISITNGIATISAKNSNWNGNETITFKATDNGRGGTPLFDTDDVTLYSVAVNDTPVIQGQQPVSVLEDSQVIIQFSQLSVFDPDNIYPDDFTLHVSSGSNYTVLGGVTVKPNSNYNGTLHIPVYVNDGLANSNTYSLTITVTPVNDKPWINIPSSRSAFEDAAYSMTITDGDIDTGDQLVLSSVSLPSWLTFNPVNGLLSGTPHNSNVGSNSVTIRVNDGTANVDSTFTIQVINTNDYPKIISNPENTLIYSNEYFEYIVMAEDSDITDVLTYSADQIPSFLQFDAPTHKLFGTPTINNTGTFAVSLKVSDGTVSVYQNFNLKVELKSHPPQITSTHVYSVNEDSQYLYALKATDLDNDPLTYTSVEIPNWLTFYASGILIGTPTNEDVGFSDVILSVTDGMYTVYDSFTIEVINVNDPPVIKGTTKALSTAVDEPLTITLSDLVVEDDDNTFPNDFSMKLFNGTNYSVIDYTIIPNTKFMGILEVTVEVNDGTDSSEADIPIYVGVSSVKEFNNDQNLLVYPVPADNNINFKFNLLKEDAKLILYNTLMQPLRFYNIPAMTKEYTVNLEDLPVGIIFYRISYENGNISGSFLIER